MDNILTTNYIRAIAEARSISVAAENLGISQPALSAYLKKTEGQLGTLLFDRSKKPLTLTEAGRIYLQYVSGVEILNKEFRQKLSDIEELKTGNLTLGGASFFNITYLPDAVARFISMYPGVDVKIVDGKIPEISLAAINGKVDLFISPEAEDTDRFHYEKLLREKIFICVPEQWKINKSLGKSCGEEYKIIGKEDFALLSEEIFILLNKEQHIGRKMNELFRRYDFKPKHTVSVEQTLTSFALTRAGVGISLVTESTVRNGQMGNHPCLYIADEEICSREMYVAYPKSKYLSKATEEFIEILKEVNKNR